MKSNNIKGCIYFKQKSQQKEEQQEKNSSKEFVVEVDDCEGDYLSALLDVINKYKGVNFFAANTIRCGDFLVFTKNDIKIRKNWCSFCGKSYSLIYDYYKIKDLVKKLYKKDDNLPCDECKNCPYYKSARRNMKEVLFDGEFIDIDEKVSIFNNFVKIGFDTFDIFHKHGKNLVDIDDDTYEVIVNDIFIKPSKKESFCSKVKKCLKLCR